MHSLEASGSGCAPDIVCGLFAVPGMVVFQASMMCVHISKAVPAVVAPAMTVGLLGLLLLAMALWRRLRR